MSLLRGVRVTRGPDWKWGNQDGGIGNIGTVISPEAEVNKSGERTVLVTWDSGFKAKYRAGPAWFDLRIVDNAAMSVKHFKIPCDHVDCFVKEICGIRWKCAECKINLCTACFIKLKPHNKDHWKFYRFDGSQLNDPPPTIACWSDAGPESRIPFLGIHKGAKVTQSEDWIRGESESIGLIGEAGIVGYRNLEAFPVFYRGFDADDQFNSAAFSVGDFVKIDPSITIKELRIKQADLQRSYGEYKPEMGEYIGAPGRVESSKGPGISVRFKGLKRSLYLNPVVFKKINNFSVNQLIRIRNDREVNRKIEKKFGKYKKGQEKLEGTIGRVIEVHEDSPATLVFVQLYNKRVYNWLPKNQALPSAWMENYETAHPDVKEEIIDLSTKSLISFFKSVENGDFLMAKLIYTNHGVHVNERNPDGKTALQVACELGCKDIVEWLINESEADLEKPDFNGFRALHYAVLGCDSEILKMLIHKGVKLDSQTDSGKRTPLHLAVYYQLKDCMRLLIKHGCDVNIQDSQGNTPLHDAIIKERALDFIQIITSSGRINWKLRNRNECNVLHILMSSKIDLRVLQLFLKEGDKDLVFELRSGAHNFTFLHSACNQRNVQAARLLIEHVKLEDQEALSVTPAGSSQLQKLLEAKTINGKTALAISCSMMDYATVELLIESGANVKVVDKEERSLPIIVAKRLTKERIPMEELSPSISRFKKKMKEPALAIIAYLLDKGCCWNLVRKDGKNASDILLLKGFSKESIQIIDRIVSDKNSGKVSSEVQFSQRQTVASLPSTSTHPFIRLNSKSAFNIVRSPYMKKQKSGCADEDFTSQVIPSNEAHKTPAQKRKQTNDGSNLGENQKGSISKRGRK